MPAPNAAAARASPRKPIARPDRRYTVPNLRQGGASDHRARLPRQRTGSLPMFRTFAAAAALLVAFVAPVQAQSSDAAKALYQLFDEEWERGLRENPVNASYQGDR